MPIDQRKLREAGRRYKTKMAFEITDHPYLANTLYNVGAAPLTAVTGTGGGLVADLFSTMHHLKRKQEEIDDSSLTNREYRENTPFAYRHPYLLKNLIAAPSAAVGALAGAALADGSDKFTRLQGGAYGAAAGMIPAMIATLAMHHKAKKKAKTNISELEASKTSVAQPEKP